ncbi:deoxyguanosinetriphosphate triphosphohydrolase [Baekduia sp. Peel2402]|uniref:deoxyguanosinetriphosphate triphosphohydrolase n=1 Tax=Baekduia sp. Peel2402 TaxID=3458296 RepID=UPI00403E8575
MMDVVAAPGKVAEAFATRQQAWEEEHLSPSAARSYPGRRRVPETDCGLRTPLQRDRDRITHSKAFRRLKHKTQVFVSPEGDHYRTRLTHTLEVTQVSRTVARALALNEDLTEAIGLGHDLGHSPFGHIGEAVLDACMKEHFGPERGFRHWEHSLRIVDVLEKDGRGLNLTSDVRDGILSHSGRSPEPTTLEAAIVRIVDRIAYINHDIDDAIRAGLLHEDQLPAEAIAALGDTGSHRIDALVHDLVEHSSATGTILQSPRAATAMDELRTFMFDTVYLGARQRAEATKIDRLLRTLFNHYISDPTLIPDAGTPSTDPAQRVIDYLAGMTDRYAVRIFESLTIPDSVV